MSTAALHLHNGISLLAGRRCRRLLPGGRLTAAHFKKNLREIVQFDYGD
jgi:hypothetical protein